MGVEDVEELFTMEQVGEIFDNGFSEWWFNRYGNGEEQIEWFDQRNSDWFFQRIILYPFLYRKERKEFLEYRVIEEMGTYVRGQFTGSNERITKQNLLKVADLMLTENPKWWECRDRKKNFLSKFAEMFPKCCDGERPERTPRERPMTQSQPVSIPSQIQLPQKPISATGPRVNQLKPAKANRSGKKEIQTLVCGFLVVLALVAWVLHVLLKK